MKTLLHFSIGFIIFNFFIAFTLFDPLFFLNIGDYEPGQRIMYFLGSAFFGVFSLWALDL